jgi:DNA (cytosine-5)-methyltransferase 1
LYLLPMPALLTDASESGLWLTPCATDAKPITGGNLYQTATGSVRHMRPDGKSSNRGLAAQVIWPTPNASDNRDRGNMSDPAIQRRLAIGKQIGLSMQVKESPGSGSLNPTWVEWLMGWPLGWTDLQPSATDKCRNVPPSRGESSEAA